MALEFTTSYIEDTRGLFVHYRHLAERALAQVDDAAFFAVIDPESNSMALIVKHLAGNMRSRWTDLLTTDGEKPWRDRDSEFEQKEADSRAALMAAWNDAWTLLLSTLDGLSDADLARTVVIRNEPHSVLQAINRQMAHYAYHCGQIVLLARHLCPPGQWTSLTVPRGQSAEFNRRVARGEASQR